MDYAFQLEEVDHGLRRLKSKKAADHSGISAEHLKYGGHLLTLWFVQILNAMVEFESIPESLILATLTPIYKGVAKVFWREGVTGYFSYNSHIEIVRNPDIDEVGTSLARPRYSSP